jgi:hypothetical protein
MKEATHHHGEDQYPDFENLMKWDNDIIAGVFDQRLLAFRDREGAIALLNEERANDIRRRVLAAEIFLGPDTWPHALIPA